MLKMYAFIQEGKVQNIVPCHSQEEANEIIKMQYTEDPIAVEIDGFDLTIGDKYENGLFFHFNHQIDDWVLLKKETSEEVKKLQNEINVLRTQNNNGNTKPNKINYDTCLFEEYVDFRIGEAVHKYTKTLENSFIIFNIHIDDENIMQHQVNMSHNNWCSFMNMYNSYKVLKDAGYEDIELCWFDGDADEIEFKSEDDCLRLMKLWRDQNIHLMKRLNNIVKQIRSCKKKSEVKAIEISFS